MEERFKKVQSLALFDEKDHLLWMWKLLIIARQRILILSSLKGMYINDIEKYKGYSLKIAEEKLTDLEDGEFYYHEIIGLDVYENDCYWSNKGNSSSQVPMMFGWLAKRQERFLLLPYIPPVVLNIDIPNNRVDVELLEGLDDEN